MNSVVFSSKNVSISPFLVFFVQLFTSSFHFSLGLIVFLFLSTNLVSSILTACPNRLNDDMTWMYYYTILMTSQDSRNNWSAIKWATASWNVWEKPIKKEVLLLWTLCFVDSWILSCNLVSKRILIRNFRSYTVLVFSDVDSPIATLYLE